MGKSLRIMAAVSLFLMSLFSTAWSDDYYIIGDADGNGSADIFDALTVAKYDAGLKSRYDFLYLASGDTDCNGKIDIFDALRIAEFDAKIITGFECIWSVAGDIPSYDPGSEPAYNDNTDFSLNTDHENPLLAVIKTDNGWVIEYFGTKNADGTVKSVNFICSKTPEGDTITNSLDDYGRIVQAGTGNGKIIIFDWKTRTISVADGFLPCPQTVESGSRDARESVNFSKEECKAFAENSDLLCMTSSSLASSNRNLWLKIAGYVMLNLGCPAIHTLLLEDICCVCQFSSEQAQRCYGGVGSKCDGINRFISPDGVPLFAPMRKNYNTCEVTGFMSAGSILHDICCLKHPNGAMCGNNINFLCNDDEDCCKEWKEAFANTSCSSVMNSPRQWEVTWGPYQCGNTGDNTDTKLFAPPVHVSIRNRMNRRNCVNLVAYPIQTVIR